MRLSSEQALCLKTVERERAIGMYDIVIGITAQWFVHKMHGP
jgi:hypothetical protein